MSCTVVTIDNQILQSDWRLAKLIKARIWRIHDYYFFFESAGTKQIEESEKGFIRVANRGKRRRPLLRLTGKTLAGCTFLLPRGQ